MPVYNADKFLAESIHSVLNQTHKNLELLIINDGSTDNSKNIIKGITDSRIRYFEQVNSGVSAARNIGLSNMTGDFFCFLDADDLLPLRSLAVRLVRFQENPEVVFMDGGVLFFGQDLNDVVRNYHPGFKGYPLMRLLQLSQKCFAGLTWMVRRDRSLLYKMKENITHGEDLLFLMELARRGGKYDYVNEVIYHYRQHAASAMRSLEGLEVGYKKIYREIRHWKEANFFLRFIYQTKTRKFLFLDWIKRKNYSRAFWALVK